MHSQEHPLQETFRHIHQLSQYIGARFGTPTENHWFSTSELLAPQSAPFATQLAAMQKRLHTTAANIIGGALLQDYQWPVIATTIASFLVDRRVPDLQPAHVYLRVPEAGHEADEDEDHVNIAYTGSRFAVLPTDPAADHPDAYVVPDLDALRDELRTGLEAHFGWAITRLSEIVGCGQRGLWLFVADRCASTVSWLMQEQDKQATLAVINREVDALLRVPGSPLVSKKVGLFELTYKDHTHVYLDRATCCYWYKQDDGDYCTTCPHRTKEDRNERLLKYMADEYDKVAA